MDFGTKFKTAETSMPRKEWVSKNPFCRRSKLDSSEFGTLVQYYFREALFAEPRDVFYYDYIITCHFNDTLNFTPNKSYDDRLRIKHTFTSFANCIDKENYKTLRESLNFKKKPISKEAFNTYFNRIGQCVWDKFIVPLHPSFQEEDVFDDLLGMIYEKTDEITSYQELFYEALGAPPLHINKRNLSSSLVFHLLSNRSKVVRGFKRETFHLEFSRVFFICKVIDRYNVETKSIYSTEEVEKLDEIVFKATMLFLSELSESPM